MSEDTPTKVPFSAQAVFDGYWEFYHDDDCDAVLDPDTKVCSACGWRPDLQSMGARRTGKENPIAPLPSSEGTVKSTFYIDESPNGGRYFINKKLVSQEEFMQQRVHCQHQFSQGICEHCALKSETVEESYKDEREAQREFYLPQNPTAEDISQARAIIAQQKSQLFEKEQRIKELEK